MSNDDNDYVRTLREVYREWNDSKGTSSKRWLEILADDVCLKSLAGGAEGMEFSRQCHCKEDVLRYFAELAQDWEMVHYTVDEFIAEGDRVVMLGSCGWRARATGKIVSTPKADFIRFRDGKVVEFIEFYDTAAAIAANTPDAAPGQA